MHARSLPMTLALAMLACRPAAGAAESTPPAATTPAPPPPAGPIPVMDVADLVTDARQHDGKTLKLRARAEATVSACTRSVPPSCWGTLTLRDVDGRKSFPVELQGNWAGAAIRCSFDTGTAAPAPLPSKPKPKPATIAAAGAGGGTCSPNINDGAIYEVTGALVFTGGGFTMEPTAIDRAP